MYEVKEVPLVEFFAVMHANRRREKWKAALGFVLGALLGGGGKVVQDGDLHLAKQQRHLQQAISSTPSLPVQPLGWFLGWLLAESNQLEQGKIQRIDATAHQLVVKGEVERLQSIENWSQRLRETDLFGRVQLYQLHTRWARKEKRGHRFEIAATWKITTSSPRLKDAEA